MIQYPQWAMLTKMPKMVDLVVQVSLKWFWSISFKTGYLRKSGVKKQSFLSLLSCSWVTWITTRRILSKIDQKHSMIILKFQEFLTLTRSKMEKTFISKERKTWRTPTTREIKLFLSTTLWLIKRLKTHSMFLRIIN